MSIAHQWANGVSTAKRGCSALGTIAKGGRSSFKDLVACALLSKIEPKTIEEALKDDDWIIATEEKLHPEG